MLDTESATAGAQALVPNTTRLGPVRLAVTDAARPLSVWRDVVGLDVLSDNDGEVSLGVAGKEMIVLETGAARPVVPKSLGLYHVAIHVPDRRELARFVARAVSAGARIAPTDHLISEAVYLWDPDGNGIEITFETPWRGTLSDRPETGAFAFTPDGKPHSGREPIDLDDLMAEMTSDTALTPRMAAGARIGHVHLHVDDLDRAMRFYAGTIGFRRLSVVGFFGMGDVALDYVPHIIAFNTWSGPDATQPPAGSAGLRSFTIVAPDEEVLDGIRSRLKAAGHPVDELQGGLETSDPAGNRLRILLPAG